MQILYDSNILGPLKMTILQDLVRFPSTIWLKMSPQFLINFKLPLPKQPLKLPKLHMNELSWRRGLIGYHISYNLTLIWKELHNLEINIQNGGWRMKIQFGIQIWHPQIRLQIRDTDF